MIARRFRDDTRGVVAIEFCMVAPILIALLGQSTVLWQRATLIGNINYTTEAAANSGAAVLHRGGSVDDAVAAAQAIVMANAGLLHRFTVVDSQAVTVADGKISVSMAAHEPSFFSMITDQVSAAANATS